MHYAVITGATQGIGKAIAESFLQQGFAVAICARTENDLQTLRAQWEQQFPDARIFTMVADLGKKEEVLAFGHAVLKAFPQIDVLVNNAGIFLPGKLAEEADNHLEQLMAVNLYSAYHLTRLLLPVMKSRRSGHIFNMCSVASLKAYDNGGSYSITKYALHGFSENLRHELINDDIKVTAIMPGATWSRSWAGSGIEENRLMKAADVASMVLAAWQLSPAANVEEIVLRPLKGDI